jgi:hypothetical protein
MNVPHEARVLIEYNALKSFNRLERDISETEELKEVK